MHAVYVLFVVILLNIAAVARAAEVDDAIKVAEERVRRDDLGGALQQLEPLIIANDLEQGDRRRACELAARILHARGEENFRQARIAECLADFDREVSLHPEITAEHWQRGIAYYYAGEYAKGAQQFKLHQTVNPQDVENSAWHFLCVVRGPEGSIADARLGLLPVTRDRRVPMAEILQLFAGTRSPEEIIRLGEQEGGTAKFYAELYVGLYFEAVGKDAESMGYLTAAAENPAAKESYMGDVARVHVRLRKQAAAAVNEKRRPVEDDQTRAATGR